MAARKPQVGVTFAEMPPELRREASTEACLCPGCEPGITTAERAANEARWRAWHQSRSDWCHQNGLSLLGLINHERYETK